MIAQHTDQKNCLLQILTCLICQNKATQAHICPNCSKFYCFTCITNWIKSNQSQCPYCFDFLQQKQLINCQKLCMDLSNALEKMTYSNNIQEDNNCINHNLKKNYYCKTCLKSLCSDCCVLAQQHKGHQFVKFSQVKKQFQKKSQFMKEKLFKFKNYFVNLREKNSQNLIENDKQKRILLKEINYKVLETKLKQFKDRINKKLSSCSSNIEQNLYEERNNLIDGQKMYEKLMKQLKQCPKVKLIKQQNNYIEKQILTEKDKLIHSNHKTKKNIQQITEKNIQSQLIPSYQSKKFILDNYTQLKLDGNVVYSQYFIADGLQWRLKIYPNGNQDQGQENYPKKLKQQKKQSKFEFISIFIELKEGRQQLGRFRHKIQLINQINATKKIIRQFQSQFTTCSCWGYNQFAKIHTLYEENYIHPQTDQLQIVLHIASSTYYHANMDIQKVLNEKWKKIEQNQQKIKKLMLAKEELQKLSQNKKKDEQQQQKQSMIKTCEQIKLDFEQQVINLQN